MDGLPFGKAFAFRIAFEAGSRGVGLQFHIGVWRNDAQRRAGGGVCSLSGFMEQDIAPGKIICREKGERKLNLILRSANVANERVVISAVPRPLRLSLAGKLV